MFVFSEEPQTDDGSAGIKTEQFNDRATDKFLSPINYGNL